MVEDVVRLTELLLQIQEAVRDGKNLTVTRLVDESLAILERSTGHSHVVRGPGTPEFQIPDFRDIYAHSGLVEPVDPVSPEVNAVHRAIAASTRRQSVMLLGSQPYTSALDDD